MTPNEARSMYRDMVGRVGETIILRRLGSPDADYPVRARVTGYTPQELVGGLDQGDRKVIVLAEDVATAAFPLPFETGGRDKVVLPDGAILNIQSVDDNTRRVAGVIIAYEIQARG